MASSSSEYRLVPDPNDPRWLTDFGWAKEQATAEALRRTPRFTLNVLAHKAVANNPSHTTSPMKNIEILTGAKLLERMGNRKTKLGKLFLQNANNATVGSLTDFFEKWQTRKVIVCTEPVINRANALFEGMIVNEFGFMPREEAMMAATAKFYTHRKRYDPSKGIIAAKTEKTAADQFEYKDEALGVMLSSVDRATVACTSVIRSLRDHHRKGEGMCVLAMCSGAPKNLAVCHACIITRATFWTANSEGTAVTLNEPMMKHMIGTPIFTQQKELVMPFDIDDASKDVVIESRADFSDAPQLALNSQTGVPPFHSILLVAAHDDRDLYAVIVDPTYGQFNPDGVVRGHNKMKEMFTDYSALLVGSPLAFKVGPMQDHATPAAAAKALKAWKADKKNWSINLDGTSFGFLSAFRLHSELDPHAEDNEASLPVLVEIAGLKKKKELNGQVAEVVEKKTPTLTTPSGRIGVHTWLDKDRLKWAEKPTKKDVVSVKPDNLRFISMC